MRVESLVKELRNSGETVEIIHIEKNGCPLTGLVIGTGAVRGTIYAEHLNWDKTDAELVKLIRELIKNDSAREHVKRFQMFSDWDFAKDNIIPCLRRVTNDNAVVIPFHDMQLYFRVFMEYAGGYASTIIQKDLLKIYGISEEELQKQVFENVKNSYEIRSMKEASQMFCGECGEEFADYFNEDMLVVTNKNAYYGASVVCDHEILKIIAEQIGGDYYIIPSSVHEVMIIPTEGWEPEDVNEMIRCANREAVDPEEQLSDHAYIYKKDAGEIIYEKEVAG